MYVAVTKTRHAEDADVRLADITATHWANMGLCIVATAVNTTYLLMNTEQIKLSCQFTEVCAMNR